MFGFLFSAEQSAGSQGRRLGRNWPNRWVTEDAVRMERGAPSLIEETRVV
jgi:hypothetical protein